MAYAKMNAVDAYINLDRAISVSVSGADPVWRVGVRSDGYDTTRDLEGDYSTKVDALEAAQALVNGLTVTQLTGGG